MQLSKSRLRLIGVFAAAALFQSWNPAWGFFPQPQRLPVATTSQNLNPKLSAKRESHWLATHAAVTGEPLRQTPTDSDFENRRITFVSPDGRLEAVVEERYLSDQRDQGPVWSQISIQGPKERWSNEILASGGHYDAPPPGEYFIISGVEWRKDSARVMFTTSSGSHNHSGFSICVFEVDSSGITSRRLDRLFLAGLTLAEIQHLDTDDCSGLYAMRFTGYDASGRPTVECGLRDGSGAFSNAKWAIHRDRATVVRISTDATPQGTTRAAAPKRSRRRR